MAWGDVLGTIAGDETIFIAAKDATGQWRLVRELQKLTAAPARYGAGAVIASPPSAPR